MHSAAVGLWVGVGSRDESPEVAGAAHFLEHLLFKATPTRTAVGMAEEIDAVGGELNAFTAKEHTCYYAHVLADDVDLAVDLVSDVVLRGLCRAADVEIERDVVLEEIAMRDDDPEDLLGDVFLGAMYGGAQIGRSVIGSVESIESITADQLADFHVRRYTPERMVLAVTGAVSHDEVLAAARRCFADCPAPVEPVPPRRIAGLATPRAGLARVERDGEQAHLCFGVPALPRGHADRWALTVLNAVVGGGLSSRLFRQIREERGLAYSVYSSVDSYADGGTFSVYAGCSPERLGEVADLAAGIVDEVRADGVTEAEVTRAIGSLRGATILGLEDVGSRMHRLGRAELEAGRQRTVAETIRSIERVTVADVDRIASTLLAAPPAVAVVGPFRRDRDLPKKVRRLAR